MQYTDSNYGTTFIFSAFNANEKLGMVVSNSFLPHQMGTLIGNADDESWSLEVTNIAAKDDVGIAVNKALASAKESGEFDGKSAY